MALADLSKAFGPHRNSTIKIKVTRMLMPGAHHLHNSCETEIILKFF